MEYSADIKSILKQKNQNGGLFWSREDGDIHVPYGSRTIDTIEVLGALRANIREFSILSKAIEFLLKHWTTKKTLSPCTVGIGSRFFKIEYPFLRYNLFYYVYTRSFYSKARLDNRFQDAYQLLLKKKQKTLIVIGESMNLLEKEKLINSLH